MFPLGRFRVEDQSMEPTLQSGDYVLVNRWAYRSRTPTTGDIVVLRNPEATGQFLIKRIMSSDATAGFFVLGDNTDHSRDSRHFGMVPRHLIVGQVRYHAKA
jgi:nickel-type superoxide dismutase maturation protease